MGLKCFELVHTQPFSRVVLSFVAIIAETEAAALCIIFLHCFLSRSYVNCISLFIICLPCLLISYQLLNTRCIEKLKKSISVNHYIQLLLWSDAEFVVHFLHFFFKRPDRLNEKPSVLPAVEVIAPGGSYNPDFFSHQVKYFLFLLHKTHCIRKPFDLMIK